MTISGLQKFLETPLYLSTNDLRVVILLKCITSTYAINFCKKKKKGKKEKKKSKKMFQGFKVKDISFLYCIIKTELFSI